VTFGELPIILRAAEVRDARLAWQSAQYARFAYHQPNDMPEMPGKPPPTKGELELQEIRRKVELKIIAERVKNGR